MVLTNSTCGSVNANQHSCFAKFETTVWKRGETKDVYRGCLNGKSLFSEEKVCVKTGQNVFWNMKYCRVVVTKCEKVQELAKFFNISNYSSSRFQVLVPRMALMDNVALAHKLATNWRQPSNSLITKEWVLFEEKIHTLFQIFVDKRGLSRSRESCSPSEFVHFTYHVTLGDLVVCGLKGGKEERTFTLSNPTVHSVDKRFGEFDAGLSGIETVFKNHKCSNVCKDWLVPDFGEAGFATRDGEDERCEPSAPFLDEDGDYCYSCNNLIVCNIHGSHGPGYRLQGHHQQTLNNHQSNCVQSHGHVMNVVNDTSWFQYS